jgi:putative phosphoesterase
VGPASGPSVVGLISDTHGLLRPAALRALEGSDLIVHAGDVGRPEVLDALRAVAPVVVVRGNVDTAPWAADLPETAAAGKIFVLHDVKQLAIDPCAAGFRAVVSGHSHQPGVVERNGVLYINPGSAGPRRFRLPITLARLDVMRDPWSVEFIDLA